MSISQPLTFGELLKSRAFFWSTLAQALVSLTLASIPLTHLLGFEYSMLMGLGSTILISHMSLALIRQRNEASSTATFAGLMSRLVFLGFASLLPALSIIVLNALRVRNCNMGKGLLFFLLFSGIGVFWGVAIGAVLASWKRSRKITSLVYLLPLLSIGWAVWRGLFNPPIFAYDPFFGFYPGTLYDELREITSTFLLYRFLVLAASLWLLALLALFAGKHSWLGQHGYAWRTPLLWSSETSSRLRTEGRLGTILLLLLTSAALFFGGKYRYQIGFVHTRASIEKALGGKLETANFTLIYDREAFSPRQVQLLARDHEYRYHQLVKFFGVRPRQKVTSYIFRNPAQKSKYMGAARTMIARPWAYEIYLHGGSFPHPVLKHELVHVFSAEFGVGPLKMSVKYGVLFHAAMVEGVAVAADGSRRGLSPHHWCKAMLNLRYRPDPAKILGPTGFFRQSSLMAYKIAGSFSRYLMDTYGVEKYKRVYGLANFAEVYGKSIQTLSKEWRAFLKKKVHLNKYDQTLAAYYFRRYRSIFVRVCPHEVASLRNRISHLQSAGQYFAAIQQQQKLCHIAPKSYNRLQLIRLYLHAGRLREAQVQLRGMLQSPLWKKRVILRRQLKFLQSTLLVRLGHHKRALRVLQTLQKQDLSLYWKRLLWIRMYALQDLSSRKPILDYLDATTQKSHQLTFLEKAFQQQNDPVFHYLLGRRFYNADNGKKARYYLTKALQQLRSRRKSPGSRPTTTPSSRPSTLPATKTAKVFHPAFDKAGKEALVLEIERLLARILYELGDFREASKRFQVLSTRDLPSGDKRVARDWSRRALWELRVYGKPVAPRP